ncbi:NERD domain-containing protein [Natrialba chahannaoensis]|uniref:NERD domain-containing protein n=1 Tax=Natrialba chahannaoensis TaxID=68911 RepID=UPI0013759A97|nr:NERD domain-containing protein [Natrialba chahannaoensis]
MEIDSSRVTALSQVGTGSQFQSQMDRRRNRLEEHGIDSITEAVQQLRRNIHEHGPQEFVKELWYHELIRSTSYEMLDEDTGLPPKMVEYLFGLATTIPPTEQQSSAVNFYDVIDSLSLVYDQLRLKQDEVLANADSAEERRKAHVQHSQLERELTTGRFAHGTQRREFTRRVYSRVDEELSDILGLSASEAVSLADDLLRFHQATLGDKQLAPIIQHVVDIGDGPFQVQSEDAIAKAQTDPRSAFPSIWVNVAKYDNHRLNPLGSDFENGEYERYEDTFGTIREVVPELGFTSTEFRETLEGELNNLDSFFESMSIGIGEYESNPEDLSGSFSKFDYPFDHNPIHEYPLLSDQDGRFYLGPQNSLWFSLSTRFRYNILDSKHEGIGTRKIGEGAEDWVGECLENVNDENVCILTSVDYDYRDGESDFVLLYDDTVVVIEVKTRGLRLGSRLGPFDSFEKIQQDAEEVIGEPYEEQALKLLNGIKDGNVTNLQGDEGSVRVDPDRFSDYVPVLVVARPLDYAGTILHTDLLDLGENPPYITDIYSLQTICQHLSGSGALLNYIKKRIKVGVTGRALSIDEIDYLGEYLDHGLEYPEVPEEGLVNIIHAGSHLERIYDTGLVDDMEHL